MKRKFLFFNFQFLIWERGQALVTLLFFVVIALTITSAAIIIMITNAFSASKIVSGEITYYAAESGIENALLRLLRDPNYSGETLIVNDSTVTISVSGTNPKVIRSVGEEGNFRREVQAQMNYSDGYYTFSDWKEM